METLAATLAVIFYWIFLSYLVVKNRLDTQKRAGELLLEVTKKSRYNRFRKKGVVAFVIAIFIFCVIRNTIGVYTGNAFHPLRVFFELLIISLLGWLVKFMAFGSKSEFRYHGLVIPTTGGSLYIIPWNHILHCKWLSTNGTMLIRSKNIDVQIMVAPNDIDKLNDILSDRAEIRDSKEETINADHMPFKHTHEPKPLKHGLLQFNLKTTLIFMIAASSAFTWLSIHLYTDWREQKALTQLKKFGVSATLTDGRVDHLHIIGYSNGFGDDDLRHLEAFERLSILSIRGVRITDAGLAYIEGLTSVKSLDIVHTKVTDEGLVHVGKMTQLERLSIRHNQITDAGLKHLERLTNLKSLDLAHTRITDKGLASVGKMTRLELLVLNDTQITDAGLVHLESLTDLESLGLAYTQITDKGLVSVGKMSRLEQLNLKDSQVTDAGLVHLEGLSKLTRLYYFDNGFSDKGIQRLMKKLPDLQIEGIILTENYNEKATEIKTD